MEKRDLKQIREEMAQVIEDNVNPQFEEIRTQFEGVGTRIGNLEKGLDQVRSEMVTKSYLDDKLADLEGGLIAKLKKEDIKMNRLIEIMEKKSLLSRAEIKELNQIKVFPKFSNQ